MVKEFFLKTKWKDLKLTINKWKRLILNISLVKVYKLKKS